MNSQELRALQEAYNQVYELDENRMASRMGKMPSAPAKVGKATHSIKDLTPSKPPSSEEKAKAKKALGIGEEYDKDTAQKLSNMKRVMDVEKSSGRTRQADALQKKMNKLRVKHPTNESFDLYDIILSHLLDEGYADTKEAAEAIMVNMSEDWRESIVEAVVSTTGQVNPPIKPGPMFPKAPNMGANRPYEDPFINPSGSRALKGASNPIKKDTKTA